MSALGIVKMWVFDFGWHGPACRVLSARVFAADKRAAAYLLAADPRMEAAGVRVETGTGGRTRVRYAGDMKGYEPGVLEIRGRLQ